MRASLLLLQLLYIVQVFAQTDLRSFWSAEGLALSEVAWNSVTDRASLERGLTCGACMLALHVDNGTEWLQLGGDVHTFLPILTSQTPVVSTSDLSLTHALQTIKKVNSHSIGLYISFATPTIIEQTMRVLNATFKDPQSLPFPILVSANVLSSSQSVFSDLIDAEYFLDLLDNLFPSAI